MDHIYEEYNVNKYTHLNREVVGIKSIVEWFGIGTIKTLFGKVEIGPVLSFVQMGPFGLGLDNLDGGISQLSCTQEMMNFDIHIDYIWKQSIFHVLMTWRMTCHFWKNEHVTRKHKKRNPSLYFEWEGRPCAMRKRKNWFWESWPRLKLVTYFE